jgi:hypothetical protein
MASTPPPDHHRNMRPAGIVVIVGLALAVASGAGAQAPPPFQLIFDGKHAGLMHEGTFTTSSAWCPSGSAADVSVEDETAIRRFSCAGGGEFQARVSPLPGEHGGSGTWQIVEGSGPLADLRGKGTFISTRLTGSQNDPPSITFRSVWDGIADFDTSPPTVAVTSAKASRLKPRLTYDVRLGLSLTDNGSDVVSYVLQIADVRKPSKALVYKLGRTTSAAVQSRFRIKVAKTTHALRIRIDATDAVGNAATLTRTMRLR